MHDEQVVSPFCGIDKWLTYSSYGQGEGKNKNEKRRKRFCVDMIQNEIM